MEAKYFTPRFEYQDTLNKLRMYLVPILLKMQGGKCALCPETEGPWDIDHLCFAWKWLGQKETRVLAQCDYKDYKKGKLDDKRLVKDLWELFDKADIIIAHNGDKFDVRVANARFVYHGMKPPSFYATIDTKKVAKKAGMFSSNKLDDLAQFFELGAKINTGGFSLWEGCMAGDMAAWKKMKSYNKHDVVLLEKVYLKLRPWMPTHHNMNVLQGKKMVCSACGSENLQSRGESFSRTGRRKRYQCQNPGCGAWSSGPNIPSHVVLR